MRLHFTLSSLQQEQFVAVPVPEGQAQPKLVSLVAQQGQSPARVTLSGIPFDVVKSLGLVPGADIVLTIEEAK